jgi:hypothetical protein
MKAIWRMSLLGVVGLTLGLVAPARAEEPAPAPAPDATVIVIRGRSDVAITQDIITRLKQSELIGNSWITVATNNGHVVLWGTVISDFAHMKALEIAKTTPGVVQYDDQLRLDASSPQAPSQN